MKVHNTRSPQQWQIISEHIDFKSKTVLDLGCGWGDILFKCIEAGVKEAWGVEQDESICRHLWQSDALSNNKARRIAYADLEQWAFQDTIPAFDIIICFSVLPYLTNPLAVLKWMKEHSQTSLIECQYAGDGPGLTTIKNDNDMLAYLRLAGWKSIEPIGKTLVEGRDKYRTIWMCQE
jgi:16S rRNA A1518/A1519 N6-dimethyltransferase RsmA/KsgA/DIM1 with predicted DNA glycosylase/AP lyase activity